LSAATPPACEVENLRDEGVEMLEKGWIAYAPKYLN